MAIDSVRFEHLRMPISGTVSIGRGPSFAVDDVMRIHMLTVLATTGCLVKQVPPPQTPVAELPTIDNPPPPVEGQGQVAIDTVEGPANVEAVLATETWSGTYVAGSSIRTAPVCTTPCIANLPYGSIRLRFTSVGDPSYQSIDTINIGKRPSAYRYHVGRTSDKLGLLITGLSLVTVGGIGVMTGAIFGAVSGDEAVVPVMLGGSGLAVVGAILWALGRTEVQPGAGHQWTPADGALNATR